LDKTLSIQKSGAPEIGEVAPTPAAEPTGPEPSPLEKTGAEKKTNFLPWIIIIILLAALAFLGWKYRQKFQSKS
jgi:LPXTG-motif cell wall-anchored protein